MTKILNCFMLFTWIMLFTLKLHSQDVQTILSNHYKASGAKENWDAIHSAIFVYRDSSLKDMINTETFGSTFHTKIATKINRRVGNQIYERFISYSPNDSTNISSTCYNGRDYWRQKSGGPIESFSDFNARYGKFTRIGQTMLLSRADSIKSLGTKELLKDNESILCLVLELQIDGTSTYFFINSKTWLVEASRHLSLSEKNPTTYYTNYKLVSGLMFPFKETVRKNHSLVSLVKYKSIKLNIDIPDLVFDSQTAMNTILNSISH